MIRWMCGVSLKDRRTNEKVGVEPITTFIRSGRLRWYGHVMRKGDEDWVKKCMEYRIEGRIPTKTWLESVEAKIKAEIAVKSKQNQNNSAYKEQFMMTWLKRKLSPEKEADSTNNTKHSRSDR